MVDSCYVPGNSSHSGSHYVNLALVLNDTYSNTFNVQSWLLSADNNAKSAHLATLCP